MRKVVIVLLFAAICAGVVWRYTHQSAQETIIRRSLSDKAMSLFDEETRSLTSSQIQLEKARVNSELLKLAAIDARTRAKIEALPYWEQVSRSACVGILAGAGACALLATGALSLAYIRKRSVIPQQLSEHTVLHVHYKAVKKPEFGLFLARMTEIERTRAEYPEAALKLTQDLMRLNTAQVKAFARGGWSTHAPALPETTETAAPVVHVPTFRDLYQRGEIGRDKPILFGLDSETGEPVRGTWQDLYSSAIAGQSGNGKSSTARALILQSLLTGEVNEFFILDPHRHKPEGLVNTLGPAVKLPGVKYNETLNDLPDVLERFSRRMNARIIGKEAPDKPIVLVVDELSKCIENLSHLADTLKTMGKEGRGFLCFGLFLSQSWKAEEVGGTTARDNLTSIFCHKIKPRQGQTLLQNKEKVRQVEHLPKGEVLFESTQDEPRRLKIPFCSRQDAALIYEELTARTVNGDSVTLSRPASRIIPDPDVQQFSESILMDTGGANLPADVATVDRLAVDKEGVSVCVSDDTDTITDPPDTQTDTPATPPDTQATQDSQWLAAYMGKTGETKEHIAEKLGVSVSLIKEILRGTRKLTSDRREKLEGRSNIIPFRKTN